MYIFTSILALITFLPAIAALAPNPNPQYIRGSPAQIAAYLDAHNSVRENHGAVPLIWSPDLANLAAIWADNCQLAHTEGILREAPYGENIVAAQGRFPITTATGLFLQDAGQYNSQRPVLNHFTQVVWKSTTQLGCAMSSCPNLLGGGRRATFHVCLYDPAGNVDTQAPENVQV